MTLTKSRITVISLGILLATAMIYSFFDPVPLLRVYKGVYVKYVRIIKGNFERRFSDAQLRTAIEHANNQAWVQKQIAEDLAPFKRGITHAQLESWFKQLRNPENKLAKFTVEDGQVHVIVDPNLTESRQYKTVYNVVSILAAKHLIPDCEFIVALNDYLSYVPKGADKPAAILSFAKHTQLPVERDTILIPDWMNVRYWDVLRGRIALANKLYPWQKKQNLIHWRGGSADSMQHRGKLVQLKKQFKFLDVGMTEGANPSARLDPEFSIAYKYQIALDGSRCTWERMVWQMASNTVMIKPDSPQIQWFHAGLVPYENYVPIKDVDAENIQAVYKWLNSHQDQARQISRNANQFARDNFKTEDMFAYYAVLLREYAKLLQG